MIIKVFQSPKARLEILVTTSSTLMVRVEPNDDPQGGVTIDLDYYDAVELLGELKRMVKEIGPNG